MNIYFDDYIKNIKHSGDIFKYLDELIDTTHTSEALISMQDELDYINQATDDYIVNKSKLEETKKLLKDFFEKLKEEAKDGDNKAKVKKALQDFYDKYEELKSKIDDNDTLNEEFLKEIDFLKTLDDTLSDGAINGTLNFLDDTLYKNVLTSVSNLDLQDIHIKFLKDKMSQIINIENLLDDSSIDKNNSISEFQRQDNLERANIFKKHLISTFQNELEEIKKGLIDKLENENLNSEEITLIKFLIDENNLKIEKFQSPELSSIEDKYNFIRLETKFDSKRIMFDLQKIDSTKKSLSPILSLNGIKTITFDQDYSPILELLASMTIDLAVQKKYDVESDLTFLIDNVFEKNIDIKKRISNLYGELKTTSGNMDKDFALLLLIDDLNVSKTRNDISLETGNKIKDFFINGKKALGKVVNNFFEIIGKDIPNELSSTFDELDKKKGIHDNTKKLINEFKDMMKLNSDFNSTIERNNYVGQIIIMLKKYGFKDDIKEYFSAIQRRGRITRPIYSEIIKLNNEINGISNFFISEDDNSIQFSNKNEFKQYLKDNNLSLEIKNIKGNINLEIISGVNHNSDNFDKQYGDELNIVLDNLFQHSEEKSKILLNRNGSIDTFITESMSVKYIHDLKEKIDDLKSELVQILSEDENSINISHTELIKEIDNDLNGILNGDGVSDLKILEQLNLKHPDLKDRLNKYIEKAKDITIESSSPESLDIEIERRKKKRTNISELSEHSDNSISRLTGSDFFEHLKDKFSVFSDKNSDFDAFSDKNYENLELIKNNKDIGITKHMKSAKSTRQELTVFSKISTWFQQLRKDSYHRYFNKNGDLIKSDKIEIKHIDEVKHEFQELLGYFFKSEASFEDIEKGNMIDYNNWQDILSNTLTMIEVEDINGDKPIEKELLRTYNKNQFLSTLIQNTFNDSISNKLNLGNSDIFEIFHKHINIMEDVLEEKIFSKENFDKNRANSIIEEYFTKMLKDLGAVSIIYDISSNSEKSNLEMKPNISKWLEDYVEFEFDKRKDKNDYSEIYIKQIGQNISDIKKHLEQNLVSIMDDIDYTMHVDNSKIRTSFKEQEHFEKEELVSMKLKEFNYLKNIYYELKNFYDNFSHSYIDNDLSSDIDVTFKTKLGYLNRDLSTFDTDYKKFPDYISFDTDTEEDMFVKSWLNRINKNTLQEIQNSSKLYTGFNSMNEAFSNFDNLDDAYEFAKNTGFNEKLFERYKHLLTFTDDVRMSLLLSFISKRLQKQSGNKDEIRLNTFFQEKFLSFIFTSELKDSHLKEFLNVRIIEELKEYNKNCVPDERVEQSFLNYYISDLQDDVQPLIENFVSETKKQVFDKKSSSNMKYKKPVDINIKF